jgi:hypothetical protein
VPRKKVGTNCAFLYKQAIYTTTDFPVIHSPVIIGAEQDGGFVIIVQEEASLILPIKKIPSNFLDKTHVANSYAALRV